MTATPATTPPRNFAAEFAALMAEQADLTRRAYRLMEEASRHQPATPAVADDARRETHITGTVTVGLGKALDRGATKLFDAAGKAIELRDPATWKPDAPPAEPRKAHKEPDLIPSAPDTKSPRDLVLDLYASTTLDFGKMAAQLDMTQAKVAGTVAGCRRGNDSRVLVGDAARRQAASKPSSPRATAVPDKPEPARSAVPQLAPAPRAPARPVPKAAEPIEPLPPIKTPAEAKARADARARVLRHYGETGDYESQIAQKLGYLRAWVVAFIDEARREKDPRVTVGDSRRRTRERGN